MKKKVEPHYLYLVKNTRMEVLTEAQAAHLALMEDVEVFNVNESLGMEPEMLEIEDQTLCNVVC